MRHQTSASASAIAQAMLRNSPSSSQCLSPRTIIVRHASSLLPPKVEAIFAKPSWSVCRLLPRNDNRTDATAITSKELHHLLRLSALPPPRDAKEESDMLQTLASQLHFVRAIQDIDTTGVEPLRSLRDETDEGNQAATWDMEKMKSALENEEIVGKFHPRIRRKRAEDGTSKSAGKTNEAEDWDVLGHVDRKVGRYFVVEGAPREE